MSYVAAPTWTRACAVCPPALALMVAVPAPTGRNSPPGSAMTTLVFELVYVGTTLVTVAPATSSAMTVRISSPPTRTTWRSGKRASWEREGLDGAMGVDASSSDPRHAKSKRPRATSADTRATSRAGMAPPLGIPYTRREGATAGLATFLQVRVSAETVLVKSKQSAGRLDVETPCTNCGFHIGTKLEHQCPGIELDVVEHLANRITLDDRVQHDAIVRIQADMNGVRIPEQIVKIAKNFLVCPHQKDTKAIRRAVERVES